MCFQSVSVADQQRNSLFFGFLFSFFGHGNNIEYVVVEHLTQIASSSIPMYITKLKTFRAHIPVNQLLFEFKWLFSFIEEIVCEGGINRKY